MNNNRGSFVVGHLSIDVKIRWLRKNLKLPTLIMMRQLLTGSSWSQLVSLSRQSRKQTEFVDISEEYAQ